MRFLLRALLAIVCSLPVTVWSESRTYPYEVTATVGMVADIVQNVAGDRARVHRLMGAGVDPHLYKPTRSDVAALMKADIVFYAGLLLEGKMVDVLASVGRNKPVIAVSETIPKDMLISPQQNPDHYDPHVWMNPELWAHAAQTVAMELSRFDSTQSAVYQQNAHRFAEQCKRLAFYGRTVFASVPSERRVLISSHDAFQYFGRIFDIHVEGLQGISTDSEAGLKRINELVDLIATRKIPAVFVESSVPPKSVEALMHGVQARNGEVGIGGELYSDAMGAPGTYRGTYFGMIDHNITTVARALGGNAPVDGMEGKLQ